MPQIKTRFKCYHPDCAADPETEILLDIPRGPANAQRTRALLRYCKRNHANILDVPATWDHRSPVLGEPPAPGAGTSFPTLHGKEPR